MEILNMKDTLDSHSVGLTRYLKKQVPKKIGIAQIDKTAPMKSGEVNLIYGHPCFAREFSLNLLVHLFNGKVLYVVTGDTHTDDILNEAISIWSGVRYCDLLSDNIPEDRFEGFVVSEALRTKTDLEVTSAYSLADLEDEINFEDYTFVIIDDFAYLKQIW